MLRPASDQYRKLGQQALLKALLASLAAAGGVTYLVLRTAGLLPKEVAPHGFGTPLNGKPYFTQMPPTLSLLHPNLPLQQAATPSSTTVEADKMLLQNPRSARTVASVKSYLHTLEQTEAEKEALIQQLAAQSLRLRAALRISVGGTENARSQSVNDSAGEDTARNALTQIMNDFERQIPPYPCVELHASYTAHLKALNDYVALCAGSKPQDSPEDQSDGQNVEDVRQQARLQLLAETNVTNQTFKDTCAQYGQEPDVEITVLLK